jgi:hypothetical protein
MTYRADPALDARLAALVDGLPAGPAPAVGDLGVARTYRTPRWVLVLVAVLLVLAAIVGFLLVGGHPADAYDVNVPPGPHPRMTAPEVASKARSVLNGYGWPSDEPIPSVDIISVTAGGGGGSITWTVRACGPFVGRGPLALRPHSSSGYFVLDDATGDAFEMGFAPDRQCRP